MAAPSYLVGAMHDPTMASMLVLGKQGLQGHRTCETPEGRRWGERRVRRKAQAPGLVADAGGRVSRRRPPKGRCWRPHSGGMLYEVTKNETIPRRTAAVVVIFRRGTSEVAGIPCRVGAALVSTKG